MCSHQAVTIVQRVDEVGTSSESSRILVEAVRSAVLLSCLRVLIRGRRLIGRLLFYHFVYELIK